jgi:hypothetical protein
MREGFLTIIEGWSLVDFEDLSDRLDRSSHWIDTHGPLLADEASAVRLMIQVQIGMRIRRGDFEPYISADTDPCAVVDLCSGANP